MGIPELRLIEPARGPRTPENTVMHDLIEQLKVINRAIDAVYEDPDSAKFTALAKAYDEMMQIANDCKRSVKVVQYDLNKPKRERAAQMKEERQQRMDERNRAKDEQRKANRALWRAHRRHLFDTPKNAKEWEEMQTLGREAILRRKLEQIAQQRSSTSSSNPSANPSQAMSVTPASNAG